MNPNSDTQKVCVVCRTDCASTPRFKDPEGQYLCQDCYELTLQDSGADPTASEALVGTQAVAPEPEHPYCPNHSSVPATRKCLSCGSNYCEDCMKVRTVAQNRMEFAGVAYFPMAFLAVTMSQSIAGANPAFVLLSILKIPGSYLFACLLLAVTMTALATAVVFPQLLPVPVVGVFVSYFALLYFTAVPMRILGLTYYMNRKRLGWFSRA